MPEKTKKPVGGDMVSVMRSDDPVRLRQVVALLEDNGIVSATPGLEHRSTIGIMGPYLIIDVLVGEDDAERAREILEALESGEPVDEDPPEEDEPEPPPQDPKATYRRAARKRVDGGEDHDRPVGDVRLRRVATFAAFVFPSGAHLYARQYLRALVVFALYPVALFVGPEDTPFRVLALLAVLATDVVGASYWADVSQGRNGQSLRRHTVPLAVIAVPVLIYLLAHPLAALFAGPRGRAYCEVVAACDGDRDACMREEANLRGTEAAMTAHCVECVEQSQCQIESCAAECGW